MATWNFTLDDASPALQYVPYPDGPSSNGWQALYSGVQDSSSVTCGEAAVGDSTHVTALSGASVALQFYGSAVYLYGGGNSSYQVSLDNKVQSLAPPSGDLLYSSGDLSLGTHYVNLTALPSAGQQLVLDRVIVANSVPDDSSPPTPVVYDNTNLTAVQYFGNWTSKTDPHVPNASHPLPFHATTAGNAYVALNFTGGVAVAVNGSKNCGHGTYTVKLMDSSQQLEAPSVMNASTNWLVGDSTLYYRAGLDPSKAYQLQVINTAGDGVTLTVNEFTVFQSNITASAAPSAESSNGSHHKTNVGVIVGPVIAGVVVLIIVAFVLFKLSRKKKGLRSSRWGDGSVTPYNAEITSQMREDSQAGGQTSRREKGFLRSFPYGQQSQPTSVLPPSSEPRTDTTTQPSQPSSSNPNLVHAPSPPPAVSLQPSQVHSSPQVDVNQIIELIAARIDRPSSAAPAAVLDQFAPPPEYPMSQPAPVSQPESTSSASSPPRYRKRPPN